MTDPTNPSTPTQSERSELVALLDKHRGLFLHTAQGLTDEQARLTPTVSTLSIGGLIKHVTATCEQWLDFVEHGAPEQDVDWEALDEAAYQAFANGFTLLPGETLEGVQQAYAEVAARANEMVQTVDLDAGNTLPKAPWFENGSWSNRRVFVHLVAETAQHAGHADIIRETIDGQQTMA
ncbi:MAG: DinB family protein [Propionibacteriaceae bacterium]